MLEKNGQEQSSKNVWRVPLVVLAIIVLLAVVWRVFVAVPAGKVVTPPKTEPNVMLPSAQVQPPVVESKERASEPVIKAQVTIDDAIRARQHWNPAFTDWVGKQAPDFDLADIGGKTQKLSNYKGKTVMLIFWATWCPPCRMEIPGLIQLRKQFPQDKLAIIAISYEQGTQIHNFLSKNPVNYTVIATPQSIVPEPYAMVDSIPATFFIGKDGIIRLVAEGLVLPKEAEMILGAIDS